jgi:hypothetical protein
MLNRFGLDERMDRIFERHLGTNIARRSFGYDAL